MNYCMEHFSEDCWRAGANQMINYWINHCINYCISYCINYCMEHF